MLEPADVEIKLLSAIQYAGDIATLKEIGIEAGSFLIFGQVFAYLEEYLAAYSELPRKTDIEVRFKDTDCEIDLEEPGNLEYYAGELRVLALARKLRVVIRGRIGDHGVNLDSNPDEVARLLAIDLQDLQSTRSKNIAILDRDAMVRYGQLEARIAASTAGEVIGIPTGLRCFDDYQEGWQAGEGIMIIGPKGSGKSWIMMLWATVAYKHGCKVLYFSPEMSWEECALRFDVLLANQYHKELSHTKIKTGTLVNMDEYREWLESLTERADFVCVDSIGARGFTLPSMLGLVEEHQPDIVFLDGIHLVKDIRGEQKWETIKLTADGLKESALRRKTVAIWAGQVDREGMRNATEPVSSGAQAAYSKAAVEGADRLITLGMDSDNPFRRVFKVPNNRSGREWHLKQNLIFNVDIGRIEQAEPQEEFSLGILADGSAI